MNSNVYASQPALHQIAMGLSDIVAYHGTGDGLSSIGVYHGTGDGLSSIAAYHGTGDGLAVEVAKGAVRGGIEGATVHMARKRTTQGLTEATLRGAAAGAMGAAYRTGFSSTGAKRRRVVR